MKRNDFMIAGVIIIAAAALFVFGQAPSGTQTAEVQDVITCEDSDGTDISVNGTVTSTINGQETIYIDECSGNDILKEFSCNGNRIASRLQKCSCLDGKCI